MNQYEYYIEGEIENRLLRYQQLNFEWTNVSNKYFVDYKQTWLQSYTDSIDFEGYWKIRFHDIDLYNIELPYTLEDTEATITWFDSRVDLIAKNTEFCNNSIEGFCKFHLYSGNNTITITNVSESVVEGNFDGKAILGLSGFGPQFDESLYHQIDNGKFKIKYREE